MVYRRIVATWISVLLLVMAGLAWEVSAAQPQIGSGNDSPWIYGIHWYGEHRDGYPDNGLVEEMTGGKGIWVLETVLTEDTGMWGLNVQLDKFETAHDRGHTLIIRVQPRWGLVVPGPDTSDTAPGDRMETFLPKVIEAAQRLADVAHIWQIGNEMNLGFEYDIDDLTPELYVQKYKQIRDAIKSVHSSLGPQIVLVGPVAPLDNDWLGAMGDSLIDNNYDVDGFAIHAYGANFLQDVASQAQLIHDKGFAKKPIYITEWGARVNGLSDTNEASVATFLHESFQALANYNADPANHPIVSACWFIYMRDHQWKEWSILGLHDLNPPGIDNDLYDAFQYACALDLPAGNDFSDENPEGLFIRRSPATLNPVTVEGANALDDSFTVSGSGVGTLEYNITDDVEWLSVVPTSGSSTGEADTITLRYDTASLSAGQYTGTITISDPDATNNPQTIAVDLTVRTDVPEPTIVNPNFEDDGGTFTVASGWNDFGRYKWEGVWDPQHIWAQGVSDIPPNEACGVYQTISVIPGTSYRVAVYGVAQAAEYDVAIAADPGGRGNPESAVFSETSSSGAWTELAHEFTATGPSATIFLRGRNTASWWISGKWCLFDGVTIEVLGTGNHPPTAVVLASPMSGEAPLSVDFDGTGSIDPNGDPLSYDWDFGDGSPHAFEATTSHTYDSDGLYDVILTVDDGRGGTDTATVRISVGSSQELLVNGDFSEDLTGWSVWTERGGFSYAVDINGQLHLEGTDYNGGLYQQFQTGGAGSEITISGFWASGPTVPNSQWAEVLIINGPRQPVDREDIHAGQSDVVLIYKNDTWATPGGWSGEMSQTAAVANTGSFVAAGDTATIILKSGNVPGAATGTYFDNMVARRPNGQPDNRPPTAALTATPTIGQAPLFVEFDGSASSDPDGDPLTYSWDFGDGHQGTGVQVSHTYPAAGTFTAALTVDDGNGGVDADAVFITVRELTGQGKSKLSIHTSFLGPESMPFIEQAQPTVVKILDELKVAQQVKEKSPNKLIVGRIWYDAWQKLGQGDPEDRALEWWENVSERILAYPAVDYWEGYNEPAIHDPSLMEWYARFEKKRVEILAAHGRKACIGNFSTGMPPVEGDVWEAFYPAIDAAMSNGGVLGLHEYSARDMDWLFDHGSGEGWLTGRYRKVYRQFLIPDGLEIPLIITECGIDGGVLGDPNEISKGWKSYQTPEDYFEQLKWYDSLLKEDSYVLGATIFCLEIPNWGDFDIGGPVRELLTDYVRSSGS